MTKIFTASMDHPCTKKVDIISWASIRDNKIMHEFITKNIDITLNIQHILNQIPSRNTNKNGKKHPNQLKILFVQQIETLLNQQRRIFFLEFNRLNIPYFQRIDCNDLYGLKGIFDKNIFI